MNKVSEFQLANHTIYVYNDVNKPLFEAKQVIESLLEYAQLEDCRFYKDNKMNEVFVKVEEDLTGSLPDRVWGYNRYSN